ncbi:MAG: DedA family protein [Pyrinomonadaceae bacterium]
MHDTFLQLIHEYGVYAVFALCTIEGDITLILAGVLAHNSFFGDFSFVKVYFFGTMGGMLGDLIGYFMGRIFQQTVKKYTFYQIAQPRIDKMVEKFGGYSIIVSKYIYGLRTAFCLFYGVGRMPLGRFLLLDFISCSIWVLILTSAGYFFSGAITTILGDFQQIGIALFFIVLIGVIVFYLVERFLLSETLEDANPETIHRFEERIYNIEEKLHIGHPTTRIHQTEAPKIEIEKDTELKDFDSQTTAEKEEASVGSDESN